MEHSTLNLTQAHDQWAHRPADQRYQSLEALQTALRARSNSSREIPDVQAAALRPTVGEHGDVRLCRGSDDAALSHWSFGQVARAAGAPAGYLQTLPAPLAVDCLQEGLRGGYSGLSSAAKLLVRDGEDGPELAALTSATYGRIWDHQVADGVAALVASDNRWHNPLAYGPDGTPVPSGLYASDRDCFIFMIDGGSMLEGGARAQLSRGFFVSNSETGKGMKFRLTSFLFNFVCGNHIVWSASDVNVVAITHSLYGPERFASEAMPALLTYANASAQPELDAVRRAQTFALPAPDDLPDWFAARGFSKAETRQAIAYAEREEGDCRTLWQAVQGVTAYARDLAFADARVDLQTRGGKLLDLVAS